MIKVSAIQMYPVLGDAHNNQLKINTLAHEALKNGSKIIVFPELATCGYAIQNRELLKKVSIDPHNSIFINKLKKLSKKFNAVIVMGIPEKENNKIYNSALIISSGSIAGTYRKVNLWDTEKSIFDPGTYPLPVFDTVVGRLGALICYDLWKVDTPKEFSNRDINFMVVPTNWVTINKEGGQSKTNPIGLQLAQSNAKLQKVAYICADRVGSENGIEFIGNSGVINSKGDLVEGPASSENEEILYASV